MLVLNKIDRVKKERLLELAQQFNARVPFDATFMISALNGDGVADLKRHLARAVPPGPWHYPADEISDAPLRADGVRDHAREDLRAAARGAALPGHRGDHGLEEKKAACASSRPSSWSATARRRIVLGKGGSMIQQLSMEARKELAEILEKPVHLFLFVKVREGWGDDPERYRELGLTFPKD